MLPCRRVAAGTHRADAFRLTLLHFRIDLKNGWARALARTIIDKSIDANDDGLARIDGDLGSIRRLLNLALDEAALDGRERSTHCVDAFEQGDGTRLDLIGQLFDGVRAAHWIDRVGHAGFRR